MSHTCHAIGCERPVNQRLLMCSRHWAHVPTAMQVAVKTHFNPSQCSGKIRPSLEWLKAAREAINYIRDLEAK